MTMSEPESRPTETARGAGGPGVELSDAAGELLTQAVLTLRQRCAQRGSYCGLSQAAVDRLSETLTGVAAAAPAADQVDRDEALSLAHRIIDDDHPEASPLWPTGAGTAGP